MINLTSRNKNDSTVPHYIIGLDQGTTGTTALLFDQNQHMVGRAYLEHKQSHPQPGWVEHDPLEIFQNVVQVIRNVVANSGIRFDQISGLGITNQRETVVMWEKTNSKPFYPAIVWQCRRTSKECEKFSSMPGFQDQVQKITGLKIDPYFSATKISWLLNNTSAPTKISDVAIGTMDTWLLWNFTKGKVHATDPTNASRTMIYDIVNKNWSHELCEKFQIPKNILPAVLPSCGNFGTIDPSFFGQPIPILGITGDQQAALFGHGVEAKCTFGTGAFALVHCGQKLIISKNQLLTTLAVGETPEPTYAIEGSVFMAGSIIQWLRDELKMIEQASDVDRLAEKISDNGGVYMVPAFVGLGAPYWKSEVRATLSGMHLGANRSHIARAALESIAYQIYDLFHAMEQDTGHPITKLAVDGGVTNSHLLMQFLSDILQIPILKNKMIEMTAFGAAKLAAKKLGWSFSSSQDCEIFTPHMPQDQRQRNLDGWKKAVQMTIAKS